VSSKKDKLIEDAQKLALKGQLDKAIKAYQQVMSLEPSALNHRQKLAELLVRAGRVDDAREEFEVIGKKFTSDGFYLKAIAVYKKLQGMFPGDIPITLTLANLNEKHGLVANALAEYKQVYDYYVKASNSEDALTMLEKMQNVDPQNINIKHKLAEAYFQIGQKDDSYAVFSKLATILQERGDVAAFAKLDTRIQQLFPKKSEFAFEVLAEQVANGNAANAVNGLQALLRVNSNDKRIWELIVTAFKQLGQSQKVKVAYQHFLKCFPNELSAQLGLIECLTTEKDLKGAVALLDNYELGLFAGRFLDDLERIYSALDKIDPINIRVLEGLTRVCTALGKSDEVATLQSKIQSLKGVSGKVIEPPVADQQDAFDDQDYFEGHSDAPGFGEVSFADVNTDDNLADNQFMSDANDIGGFFDKSDDSDEIEVEFDVDEEEDFEIPLESTETSQDDWAEEVGELLDAIATKPRSVKFASGIDGDDAQSHYDLGVAFREMGLYYEAINEFRQAYTEKTRQLECYILQGACLREKGDLINAEKVLKALLKPVFTLEETCAIKYELALTYGDSGKKEQLVELLTDIDRANSGFRDVRARLDAASKDNNSLNFSDDDLKGFDFN
jgi:tetratricopeptide (TPR) repeat protein